MQFISLLNLS